MFFEELTRDLSHRPAYRIRVIEDYNPISGKTKIRRIAVPNPALRIIHWRLLYFLEYIPYRRDVVTGSRVGSSPYHNVLPHRYNRFFYLLDIKSAYSQVRAGRLAHWLSRAWAVSGLVEKGVRVEVLAFLRAYCLDKSGGLLTGTPASPELFNLYAAFEIDRALLQLSVRYGLTYTRYLDDLTFSANQPISQSVRREIRAILAKAQLPINDRKSQLLDLKKGPVMITGISLDVNGRVFLNRHFLEKINTALFWALDGKGNPAQTHGLMGVFLSVYGHKEISTDQMTKLERQILVRWWMWRQDLREQKRRARLKRRKKRTYTK